MYSKSRGVTSPPDRNTVNRGRSPRPLTRPSPGYTPMDRTPPEYLRPDRPRVRVPLGYSGHAIVDGEERPLGVSPDAIRLPPDRPSAGEGNELPPSVGLLPTTESPAPRFDDLPRVSELGARSGGFEPSMTEEAPYASDSAAYAPTPPTDSNEGDTVSLPAPIPPAGGLFDARHFPFGHGFGFDEILLLGLILLLLHENQGEDRGDLDETVILLGILLLCG